MGFIPCHQVDAAVRAAKDQLAAAGSRSAAERLGLLWKLCDAFQGRFLCTNSAADLDDGIAALGAARELVPAARPEARAVALRLAMLLAIRSRPGDEEEALGALTATQKALRPGGGEHAAIDVMIGLTLLPRYLRHRREADLSDAIERVERAMPVFDAEAARDRLNPQHAELLAAVAAIVRLQLAMADTSRLTAVDSADEGTEDRVGALLAEVERLSPELAYTAGMVGGVRRLHRGLVMGEADDPLTLAETASIGEDAPFPGLTSMLATTTGAIRSGGRFGYSGDVQALDAQITALEAERADPARHEPDPSSQLTTLAQCYQLRARTKALSDDPSAGSDRRRAEELATEALGLGGDSDRARLVLGGCKLDSYRPQRPDPQVLDEAVRLLRLGTSDGGDLSPALRQAARNQLAEALIAHATLTRDPDEVEEAVGIVTMHRDRFRPGSLQYAVGTSRVAAMLHVRAEMTGTTEDLLHAADESRRATALVGELSPMWAYDTALLWAEWSLRHGRMADAAEAYLLTLRRLNQLARAQLSRAYGELALRRRTSGLLGRAAYALTRRRRLPDAVVALESGRAVLLSAALERDLVGLSAPEHLPARERYRRAVERLAAVEERALNTALDEEAA
ncbi:hypothetical protein [Micromonospora sp. DT233]|uniref:hypothetical protein n=1 Tax=Micromonospora sp. DT233 TaxID=3393432 RepID=UPI003CF6C7E8